MQLIGSRISLQYHAVVGWNWIVSYNTGVHKLRPYSFMWHSIKNYAVLHT